MNIIPQPAAFRIEERITTATGVEKPANTEPKPAGNSRDEAWKVFTDRIAENPYVWGEHTGMRLVLIGGDR